jgi:hypothetical protein
MKKDPAVIPYGFRPESDDFRALIRDCEREDLQHKFRQLQGLSPRGLRAEVGAASRLIEGVWEPTFLAACRPGVDLGPFIQQGGMLLVERGTADEDVTRTIIGGLTLLITEHCENRRYPDPPVAVLLDECTNARTAGPFEERKAGETRKRGLHWVFICQHPNFPNGPDGYYQNCQEKHFYRTGDYTLAKKHAGFVAAAMRHPDETHASVVNRVASELMTFGPGRRYVVGLDGVRKDQVEMATSAEPDWPGLREDLLEEKLCDIYRRPEYRISGSPVTGGPGTGESSTSSPDTPPRPPSSPSSSPAERWQRERERRAGGSSATGGGDG